tara:strand:+ start:117 stop:524 length:408 start_codon:yes stop_codon:yes gene_type:complete
MALWEVTLNGDTTIEYSDGGYSQSPPISGTWVRRHTYKVPYTNVGKGGFIEKDGKKFHTPSWIEVHPETTHDDIVVDKKPFDELFAEPEKWEFKSASSDKMYTVKRNKYDKLSCDCWGYIAHKKCKHIKEVESYV